MHHAKKWVPIFLIVVSVTSILVSFFSGSADANGFVDVRKTFDSVFENQNVLYANQTNLEKMLGELSARVERLEGKGKR